MSFPIGIIIEEIQFLSGIYEVRGVGSWRPKILRIPRIPSLRYDVVCINCIIFTLQNKPLYNRFVKIMKKTLRIIKYMGKKKNELLTPSHKQECRHLQKFAIL